MYRKILVPLDGSKEAEKVLPIVKNIRAPGGRVVLVHVIPPRRGLLMGQHVQLSDQREETERARATDYLKSVISQLGEDSSGWRSEVVSSKSVSQGILDVATREGVDLIAMYTHTRNGGVVRLMNTIAGDVQLWSPIEVRVFSPQELAERAPVAVAAAKDLEKALLKATDIFKSLSDQQLDSVASLAQRLRVPAGQVLGKAGEPGDRLFIIIAGDVQLAAHSAVGEITVRIAGPGESFPLAALVEGGTQITASKALTNTELLAVPRAALLRLCEAEPEIGLRVYSAIAGVFANRYSKTLAHLSVSTERMLKGAEFLANV